MVTSIGEGVIRPDVELRMDETTVVRQAVGTGDFVMSAHAPERLRHAPDHRLLDTGVAWGGRPFRRRAASIRRL